MFGIPKIGYPHAKIPRRDFLHIGGLSVAGIMLAHCLPFDKKIVEASVAGNKTLDVRSPHEIRFTTPDGKDPGISLIVIDLQGGASWFDMFDRKPNSPFKSIDPSETTSGEIFITEPLRPLAKHLHKLVVFKNLFCDGGLFHDASSARLYTGNSDQASSSFNANPKYPSSLIEFSRFLTKRTGPEATGFLVTHSSGSRFELSNNKEISTQVWREPFSGTHFRNDEAVFAPYNETTGGYGIVLGGNETLTGEIDEEIGPISNIDPRENIELVKSRLKLLEQMDSLGYHFAGPTTDRWKKVQGKINTIINGEVKEAFDLSREPEDIKLKYGTGPFGKQFLTARRLVERGVRVIVSQRGDFDNHGLIEKNLNSSLPEFAFALSALIDDIERSGLKVVVAVVTEFGRTPNINSGRGRDHWGQAFGALFTGYGIEGNRSFGKTNTGGYPVPEGDKFPAAYIGDTLLDKLHLARFELRNGQPTNNRFAYIKF